jgi:hypothetical protein
MNGKDFRAIRNKLGLTKHDYAIQLGYRGNELNNTVLMKRYEQGRKQIPLTVASLAFLLDHYFDHHCELPNWPDWPGYEEPKGPPVDYDRYPAQSGVSQNQPGLDTPTVPFIDKLRHAVNPDRPAQKPKAGSAE